MVEIVATGRRDDADSGATAVDSAWRFCSESTGVSILKDTDGVRFDCPWLAKAMRLSSFLICLQLGYITKLTSILL